MKKLLLILFLAAFALSPVVAQNRTAAVKPGAKSFRVASAKHHKRRHHKVHRKSHQKRHSAATV